MVPRTTAANQTTMELVSLDRYPEDGFVLPPEDDPLSEELGLALDELEVGVDAPLPSVVEPEPLPKYGQGLQSGYENPQVWPRRHVQAKPRSGSRGQFWIPVQVPLPEPESDPDPESDLVAQEC